MRLYEEEEEEKEEEEDEREKIRVLKIQTLMMTMKEVKEASMASLPSSLLSRFSLSEDTRRLYSSPILCVLEGYVWPYTSLSFILGVMGLRC